MTSAAKLSPGPKRSVAASDPGICDASNHHGDVRAAAERTYQRIEPLCDVFRQIYQRSASVNCLQWSETVVRCLCSNFASVPLSCSQALPADHPAALRRDHPSRSTSMSVRRTWLARSLTSKRIGETHTRDEGMPRDRTKCFRRIEASKTDLRTFLSRNPPAQRTGELTSELVSCCLVKCTEKMLKGSLCWVSKFSKNVGWPDFAMLPNARPTRPLIGSSSMSEDTLRAAQNV